MEAQESVIKGHLPRPGCRSDQPSERLASSGVGNRRQSTHPEIISELAVSAKAMAEFLAADVIVIGAPMYNFGIPSQLKAWIDRLAVTGKTFTYTPQGPKGLAGGKTVIVASSRGGDD